MLNTKQRIIFRAYTEYMERCIIYSSYIFHVLDTYEIRKYRKIVNEEITTRMKLSRSIVFR